MAIENVWIIDSLSGICIYDWCHESKEKTIDEQLVSGLLLAFRNFSSEAGLVEISAIEGIDRKLAYHADDRYIIASICHAKDYEPLIVRSLEGLLKDFRKKYKKLIDEDATTDVSPFRTFHDDIEEKLEGSTANRSWISLSVGTIIGMFIIGAVFLTWALTFGKIIVALPEAGNIVGLLILLVGFIIAGFVSGLSSGDRRLGVLSGFLLVVVIFAFFVGFFYHSWESLTEKIFYPLLYFLTFSILSLTGGYIGGFLKERKFFYPMTEFIIEEQK